LKEETDLTELLKMFGELSGVRADGLFTLDGNKKKIRVIV